GGGAMASEMSVSKDRFLAFARKLALLTSCTAAPIVACGGGSTSNTPPTTPTTSASSTSVSTSTATAPTSDGTAMPSDGPCRCSWDTNAAAAPRVCKKGETNYDGVSCIPGHPSGEGYYHGPIKGPLMPPDFPV